MSPRMPLAQPSQVGDGAPARGLDVVPRLRQRLFGQRHGADAEESVQRVVQRPLRHVVVSARGGGSGRR